MFKRLFAKDKKEELAPPSISEATVEPLIVEPIQEPVPDLEPISVAEEPLVVPLENLPTAMEVVSPVETTVLHDDSKSTLWPSFSSVSLPSWESIREHLPEVSQKSMIIGGAIAAGLVASSIMSYSLFRRHKAATREAMHTQTKYLILYHFNTERLHIIRNIFMLKLVPFNIPTLSTLHRAFQQYTDVADCGSLSFRGFAEMMQPLGIDPHPMFTLFDTNHDRTLDFLEFLQVLAAILTAPPHRLYALAHASFDVTRSGAIPLASLSQLLYALMPFLSAEAHEHTMAWLAAKHGLASSLTAAVTAPMLAGLTDDRIMGVNDLSAALPWRQALAAALGCHFDANTQTLLPAAAALGR